MKIYIILPLQIRSETTVLYFSFMSTWSDHQTVPLVAVETELKLIHGGHVE